MLVDLNVIIFFFFRGPFRHSPPCLIAQRQIVQKHSAREGKCSNETLAVTLGITHVKTQKRPSSLLLPNWTDRDTNFEQILKELPKSMEPPSAICLRATPVCVQQTKYPHRKEERKKKSLFVSQNAIFFFFSFFSFGLLRSSDHFDQNPRVGLEKLSANLDYRPPTNKLGEIRTTDTWQGRRSYLNTRN